MAIRNKLYYPKSHILTNLHTSGKEWMLEDGTEFKGYYHRYIDGTVMTGAVYNETDSKTLIEYIDTITQPNNVVYDRLKSKTNYVAPHAVFPVPTLENYQAGKLTRYFIRRRNSSNFADVFEIDKDQFLKWRKPKKGIDPDLYEVLELDWKLTGPRNDIKQDANTIFGVEDTNKRIVQLKNKDFPGLKEYLTDYIELSIHSRFVSADIKKIFV
jgi:hypothetical protein